jgi:hypothetical protein
MSDTQTLDTADAGWARLTSLTEVLLEVAAWWDGSLSFPGRPRNHPNFPRDGLLRFAAESNPRTPSPVIPAAVMRGMIAVAAP